MCKVTDASIAEHYVWGQACDGWHLLKSSELSVIEERMPPHSAERSHRHARAQQFFYVLEGHAVMLLDDGCVDVSAGQGVAISPGQVHQMRNDSPSYVRFLVISQPTTRGDRENVVESATP